ncbi:MAG: GNAT family N-acetyltransferase [Pedobacter sp.]|nr:GNAT family N-acetyltransferase [Pedobacter sp.]MDQ8054068.1 GNAT family N-acetyltransferase [Pedobacter sp.]
MISSERLILKPLSYDQLIKYIANDNSLERDLKLNPTTKVISPELREALEETILPNVADTGKDHLFSTLWTIILKSESRMVGDICFVGEPDENGELELGYGTYEPFRGKGYMTEAVGCMIEWAKLHDHVTSIFAQTAKDNPASFAVLEKNNFVKIGEGEGVFNWRLML